MEESTAHAEAHGEDGACCLLLQLDLTSFNGRKSDARFG